MKWKQKWDILTYKDDDYLVSEGKCIEKDKNRVKDKKTNHPSLFSISLSLSLSLSHTHTHTHTKEVPLQSVFHSTYQPTNIILLSLSLILHIHILSKPHKPSQSSSPLPPYKAFSLFLIHTNIIYIDTTFFVDPHLIRRKVLQGLPHHFFPIGNWAMRKPDQMGKERMNNTNNKSKLRKGLWSPEEDEKLMRYMLTNGQGCWSDIARNAGLQRCGKSCRLRWINYLRPDLKRGAFSPQEEELIIHLHAILGNRFSLSLSLSLSLTHTHTHTHKQI